MFSDQLTKVIQTVYLIGNHVKRQSLSMRKSVYMFMNGCTVKKYWTMNILYLMKIFHITQAHQKMCHLKYMLLMPSYIPTFPIMYHRHHKIKTLPCSHIPTNMTSFFSFSWDLMSFLWAQFMFFWKIAKYLLQVKFI